MDYQSGIHGLSSFKDKTAFKSLPQASLARQLSYTTVRLGVYQALLEKFSENGQTPNFFAKAGMGLTAGAIGNHFNYSHSNMNK